MFTIRPAEKVEYEQVRAFYHRLIDAMQDAEYSPGWEKDIYPANEYLQESIEKKELYIGLDGDAICAAMIVNHDCNESYINGKWSTRANREEITVIHALGVHPAYSGKGWGKALVRRVFELAGKNNQKVLRLDVLKGNRPAECLYTGLGFQYVDTLPMFYEDTGWTDYELYEYVLGE